VLDDVIAHGHLSIGDKYNLAFLPNAQNRCAVNPRLSRSVTHSLSIPRRRYPVIFAHHFQKTEGSHGLIGQRNFPEGDYFVGDWPHRAPHQTTVVIDALPQVAA
jgi:hypothetical protein